MATAREITLGSIIYADVRSNGQPAGHHFAVVLNPTAEIRAGMSLRVAVCSTNFAYPLQSGWFDMPTRPGGHAMTGLDQARVVKATWLDDVRQSAVQRIMGRAPKSVVNQLLNWLATKEREAARREPPR